MTEILKSCPFCGSEAEFNTDEFGESVCCKYCGVTMHNGVYGEEGRKLASADWNARPTEDKLHEELKELEAKNTKMRVTLEEIASGCSYYSREDMVRLAKEALK